MARFDLARLDDIAGVLSEVRGWPDVDERAPATFYMKSQPFLHFHVGRDSRRADVKCSGEWIQVDLPEPVSSSAVRRLRQVLTAERRRRTTRSGR